MNNFTAMICIILAVQFLFVYSDSNKNYKKSLTMANRAEVSDIVHHAPIQKEQTMSYSNTFFQPGGATSTIRSNYLNYDSEYFKRMNDIQSHVKKLQQFPNAYGRVVTDSCLYQPVYARSCSSGSQKWCCHYNKDCGDINCKCCATPAGKLILNAGIAITVAIFGVVLGVIFRKIALSMIRSRRIDNHSRPSIEQQLIENSNSNSRMEIRTPGSLPEYNDIMQENSVIITMPQQSLLPPSYDDFIRGNNHERHY